MSRRMSRAGVVLIALLAGAMALPTLVTADCEVAGGFQTYYILGREDHMYEFFLAVDAGEPGGNPITQNAVESVITLAATIDAQQVFYDHWEDGYDPDPFTPGPSTEIFNLNRGDVLSLKSDGSGLGINQVVPANPRGVEIRYDGGDRILSIGGPVSVVHSFWPENYAFIAGSMEIYPENVNEGGFSFFVPVGEDSYDGANGLFSPFKYVRLDIQAFNDGTAVRVDNGGTQVTVLLNKGESYSTRGLINGAAAPAIVVNEGTQVISSKEVQIVLVSAAAGQFQLFTHTLVPQILWAQDYVAGYMGSTNATRPANAYIFNPDPINTANVTAFDTLLPNGRAFTIPPRTAVAYADVNVAGHNFPPGSPIRITSQGLPIWGIVAVTGACDWSFTLLPSLFLQNNTIISWSPGADDQNLPPGPDVNVNPVYVVPTADFAIVCVDLDQNGVFDDVDTNGDGATNPGNADYTADGIIDPGCYAVNLFTSPQGLRIFDTTDSDNTGTRIVSTVPFAATYGQDPNIAAGGNTSELDLGYNVLPTDQRFLERVITVNGTTDVSTVFETGGTFNFRIDTQTYEFSPVTNIALRAQLPTGLVYQPGSSVFTPAIGGPMPIPDPVMVGPDLVWTGVDIPDMLANEQGILTFAADIAAAAPGGRYTVTLFADGTYNGRVFTAQQCVDVFKTTVQIGKLADVLAAAAGDTITYTLEFEHSTGVGPGSIDQLLGLILRDVVPPGTTYVPGSATYNISTGSPACPTGLGCTGTYNAATRSVSFGPFDSIASTNTNLLGSFSFQVVLGNDPQIERVCNTGELISSNVPPSIPNIASARVCTDTLRPVLTAVKTAPPVAIMGQAFNYTIAIQNTGLAVADGVLFSDIIPTGASYVPGTMTLDTGTGPIALTDINDADQGEYVAATTTVVIQVGTLDIGDVAVVTFSVYAPFTVPAQLTNAADLSATVIPAATSNLTLTDVRRSACLLQALDQSGASQTSFLMGAPIRLRVTDPDQNSDPLTTQTVTVVVRDLTTTDMETVVLTETGPATGVFELLLPTALVSPPPTIDNGTLEVQDRSDIDIAYDDVNDPASTDTCQLATTMRAGLDGVDPVTGAGNVRDICALNPPGDNNGIDPGDTVFALLAVTNNGLAPLTGAPGPLVGILTSSNGGVTINQNMSTFSDITVGSTIISDTEYEFVTDPATVRCGDPLGLQITFMNTSLGTVYADFSLNVDARCAACVDVIVQPPPGGGVGATRDDCPVNPPGNDGDLDPGDDWFFLLEVENPGPADLLATGAGNVMTGTLTVVNPVAGVSVLPGLNTSTYPDILSTTTEASQTEFGIRLDNNLACGTVIDLQLVLTNTSHGDKTVLYQILVSDPCEVCARPGGCPNPLPTVTLLKAIKVRPPAAPEDVQFSWTPVVDADNFVINSVIAKAEIPDAYTDSATPAPSLRPGVCVGVGDTSTSCDAVMEMMASGPSTGPYMYYQVVYECGGQQGTP